MFKEFPDDDNRNDDFLNEFRQKISDQNIESLDEKKDELKRSKNIFLGIAGGVTLAGIVGWMILAPQYRVESEKEIPVIRRPQTAIRVQPNEPGGMDIPNQDKTVYNIIEKKDNDVVENLLPPPEMPKLPVITAEENITPSTVDNTVVAEAESVIQKAEEQNIPAEEIVKQAEESLTVQAQPEPSQVIEEAKEEPTIQVAQEPSVQPKHAEVQKPVVTQEEPKVVMHAEVKAPEISEKPKPAQQSQAKAVAGNWQIQLMSSPNKSAVEKAQIDLGKKYKISNLPFEIEAAVLDMNKTFYRLKVGAFKTRPEADKLCNDIKALGGTCIVKKK